MDAPNESEPFWAPDKSNALGQQQESTTSSQPLLTSKLTRYNRGMTKAIIESPTSRLNTVKDTMASMLTERVQLEPLDEETRDQAQRLVDQERPLKDVPIQYVLPFLQKCCCKLPSFIPHSQDELATSDSEDEYIETDENTESERTDSGGPDEMNRPPVVATQLKRKSILNTILVDDNAQRKSQLEKYQVAARNMASRKPDWKYTDLCMALDNAYIEKESKVERAFQDIFRKMGNSISDISGGDRLSQIMDKHKQEEAVKDEAQRKPIKKKKANKDNTFLQLGVAIENFFHLQVQMICIFFVLTLLTLPQLIIFMMFGSNASFESSTWMDNLTFAGLGQATTLCSKSPNFFNEKQINLTFSCPKNYQVTKIFSSGLVGFDVKTLPGNQTEVSQAIGASTKVCYLDSSPLKELTYQNVDIAKLNTLIGEGCFYQQKCSLHIDMDMVVYRNSTWVYNTPAPGQFFFAQVGCTAKNGDYGDYMNMKRYLGLLVATIGVFMCIYYTFTMVKLENEHRINSKLLDYELVSIEDYSVRGKVNRGFYEWVVSQTEPSEEEANSHDASQRLDNVPIRRFKRYMANQFQEKLQELGVEQQKSRVADICFAFNNRSMLKLLLKRHKVLSNAKFDEATKLEENLTKLKDENYEELIIPNQFYCTFQEGEAQQKVLEAAKFKIGDHSIKFKDTKSPDDIIWQNRGIDHKFQMKRASIVGVVIFITVLLLFYIFCLEVNGKIYIKYRASPPGVDCDALYDTFQDQEMKNMAGLEYIYIQSTPMSWLNLSSQLSNIGALPCFCKSQAEAGFTSDQVYEFDLGTLGENAPICQVQMTYMSLFGLPSLINIGLSIMIVAQSFLARSGFIQLTKLINFTSNSQRMRVIIVSVFTIFFVNQGLMYLIAPLKLEWGVLSLSMIGIYEDFNAFWFSDIGNMVVSGMVVNALILPLEAFMFWIWQAVRRSYDQSRCWRKLPPEQTKTRALSAYKQLYSGLEFDIHYQYSHMLVIVWMAFLFGSGLPILFPIALFGLVVLYITNRLTLAYLCKAPPVYDEKMNLTTIKLLKIAPMLYVSVGAWVYSNQQTFYNKLSPNTGESIFMPSDHKFSDFWYNVTPGAIFVVYIFMLFVIWLSKTIIKFCHIRECCHLPLRAKDIQVQQELASFFSSLPRKTRESLIREEVQDALRTGSSKLSKDILWELVMLPGVTDKSKRMTGPSSFRILRTPIAEQFGYVCPGIKGQKQTDFVISQYKKPAYKMCSLDVVNVIAYLAFLDPEEVKSMRFHIEDLYEQRKKIEAQEEEDDLVSQITEEASEIMDDDMSYCTEDILTPSSSKSFQSRGGDTKIN